MEWSKKSEGDVWLRLPRLSGGSVILPLREIVCFIDHPKGSVPSVEVRLRGGERGIELAGTSEDIMKVLESR